MAKAKRGKGGRFMKAARSTGGRARKGAKRVVRYARRAARRVRSRGLGLVGKTGVGIMGGAPIAFSGLDSAEFAVAHVRTGELSLLSAGKVAFARFLNNISIGFGQSEVFHNLVVHDQTGKESRTFTIDSGVPSGSWWKTTFVGGLLVAFDIGISWASSKLAKVNSGVRFMGQKLTGGK